MSEIIFDEQSTGVITCAFTDENGDDVAPNVVIWTLTTSDGQTVINEREQVDFDAPGAEIEIVLHGGDLQILEAEAARKYVVRKLTIQAEYDSDLGNNLPLTGETTFKVRNLSYI